MSPITLQVYSLDKISALLKICIDFITTENEKRK